jgi:hypothetical protein
MNKLTKASLYFNVIIVGLLILNMSGLHKQFFKTEKAKSEPLTPDLTIKKAYTLSVNGKALLLYKINDDTTSQFNLIRLYVDSSATQIGSLSQTPDTSYSSYLISNSKGPILWIKKYKNTKNVLYYDLELRNLDLKLVQKIELGIFITAIKDTGNQITITYQKEQDGSSTIKSFDLLPITKYK